MELDDRLEPEDKVHEGIIAHQIHIGAMQHNVADLRAMFAAFTVVFVDRDGNEFDVKAAYFSETNDQIVIAESDANIRERWVE